MSVIQLPGNGVQRFGEFIIGPDNEHESPEGGVTISIARPGSKWGFRVKVTELEAGDARPWKLLHMRGQTFRWTIPQPDLVIGPEGTPQVDGENQTGMTVVLKNLEPGLALVIGQWITIITLGRRYNYMVRANGVADVNGDIAVDIMPMLRVSPSNNDVVEIATPQAEGTIRLPQDAFEIDEDEVVRSLSFEIRERR